MSIATLSVEHPKRHWKQTMSGAKQVTCMVLATVVLGVAGELHGSNLAVKDGESIAFLGDSITAAGAREKLGYVNLVIRSFAANDVDVRAIPAGIGGHKSNQMLARLERDVLKKKPDWMTLSCGVNDVLHGAGGVSLEDYKVNITEIVDRCQAAGIKVMILTATMTGEDQANANNKTLLGYNEFLKSLAKEKKCLLADLNAEMQAAVAKAGPGHNGKLLTSDGVHMNRDGNIMMAIGVLKAFGMTDEQLEISKRWSGPKISSEPGPHLIIFFGDSITKAGGYYKIIRNELRRLSPAIPPDMHNFGHASETVSNLSEAYHPGRRPCIHNWVGAIVEEKPNLISACYGINDAIYHPFNEERFAAYKNGIESLIEKFQAVGSYVVLFTPPPFAAKGPAFPEGTTEAERDILLAQANAAAELEAQKDPNKFGYRTAYPYYDEVMARYADYILSLSDREGVSVVDIRTPMLERIHETHGGDAIHPNGTGHAVMAEAFLKKWPKIKDKANAYNKAFAKAVGK
jgi:lysophospholipase L1-like esterase